MGNDWRSLEEAPKDGTHILLGGNGWVASGYWESDKGHEGWFETRTHWTDPFDGSLYPTNWQPLPEPPHG